MNEIYATVLVSICLYSTGHWIGGTVTLLLALYGAVVS
jgi:hypothetical protein